MTAGGGSAAGSASSAIGINTTSSITGFDQVGGGVPGPGMNAGAGMSSLSCVTTITRPSIARDVTNHPSISVRSTTRGAVTSETSTTVTAVR